MTEETRRYLVIVSLSDSTPQRLGVIVPWLQDVLAQISTDTLEMAFHSMTRDIFGYFVKSSGTAGQIKARLESPGKQSFQPSTEIEQPMLFGEDSLFIIEIGEDFQAGKGFTRAGTWLQRH